MNVLNKSRFFLLSVWPVFFLLAGCDREETPERDVAETTTIEATGSITGLRALGRMHRIDLIWDGQDTGAEYEIRRGETLQGPFENIEHVLPRLTIASDVIGREGVERFYQVRRISAEEKSWSAPLGATTLPYERSGFLTEVQEAGFRYFYHFSNPVSHLPLEGIKRENSWTPNMSSAASTGMYFFNMAVGIERGFIAREEAAAHVLVLLTFLRDDVEKFHGAFPHWIDGYTGKALPFSEGDTGADLVETAIIAQGLIFAREYFSKEAPVETSIREVADGLWRGIEWDKFIRDSGGANVMMWHWTPEGGFGDLEIVGFNEAEIAYLLAVGSPTHPVDASCYRDGWMGRNEHYFNPREVRGVNGPIKLQLTKDYGIPMFVMHYSYLGLDPRLVPLPEGNLFEEFQALTLANHDYCQLNPKGFKDYGRFWGLTASLNPDGYLAHEPGENDNGTISPTGAVSSIAYQPEKVLRMMEEMYLKEGGRLWGPFGFYDAFNPTRDWVAAGYIGIDVGPIAPMIENHRTEKLWEVFMRAPEIRAALEACFPGGNVGEGK